MDKKKLKKNIFSYFRNCWKDIKSAVPMFIKTILHIVHAFFPFAIFTPEWWLE